MATVQGMTVTDAVDKLKKLSVVCDTIGSELDRLCGSGHCDLRAIALHMTALELKSLAIWAYASHAGKEPA